MRLPVPKDVEYSFVHYVYAKRQRSIIIKALRLLRHYLCARHNLGYLI